jgi:hypothetical protein
VRVAVAAQATLTARLHSLQRRAQLVLCVSVLARGWGWGWRLLLAEALHTMLVRWDPCARATPCSMSGVRERWQLHSLPLTCERRVRACVDVCAYVRLTLPHHLSLPPSLPALDVAALGRQRRHGATPALVMSEWWRRAQRAAACMRVAGVSDRT